MNRLTEITLMIRNHVLIAEPCALSYIMHLLRHNGSVLLQDECRQGEGELADLSLMFVFSPKSNCGEWK
jgi:hypothetical protein